MVMPVPAASRVPSPSTVTGVVPVVAAAASREVLTL